MPEFDIALVKTVITRVKVKAETSYQARKQLTEYGLTEAVSDYPIITESTSVTIKQVREI